MEREKLTRYLDELFEAARFRDYCPNALALGSSTNPPDNSVAQLRAGAEQLADLR